MAGRSAPRHRLCRGRGWEATGRHRTAERFPGPNHRPRRVCSLEKCSHGFTGNAGLWRGGDASRPTDAPPRRGVSDRRWQGARPRHQPDRLRARSSLLDGKQNRPHEAPAARTSAPCGAPTRPFGQHVVLSRSVCRGAGDLRPHGAEAKHTHGQSRAEPRACRLRKAPPQSL